MKSISQSSSKQNLQDAVEYIRRYNENFILTENRQPLAYTHSYGCQQNTADNEIINGLLLDMGYIFTSDQELADIVIYNTCAVRENAEDRVFGNIGELKAAKEKNPAMIIAIFGCMVQQKHVLEKLEKSYPFVDIMFGSGVMHMLPQLLAKKISDGGKVISINPPTVGLIEELPIMRHDNIRASVPIMSGCNNFCSYCIVPYVRGRERSRESGSIVNEVRKLVDSGYKEITLLGQNVNSYGNDIKNELSFSKLLQEIANIPGKFRLRFMTSHPKDCTKELLDTIKQNDKICRHIHLPVQSGSNTVLDSMERGYTRESYKELVDYAREIMPDFSFSSDIIVGFPGETKEDFDETLALVDYVGYSSLFTFIYSSRPGTKAASMEDSISQKEKVQWLAQLIELQRKKANNINSSLVGTIQEVLVESVSKKHKGYMTGRTDSNIIVLFKCEDESIIGEFKNIEISKYMNWAVKGKLVNKENTNG